jgi:Leucine-rich repeat (LRR) protein
VNRNRIESFPPSIRKCKQLQVLRADKNKFNVMPQPLSLCQSIREMSFSDNHISTISNLFSKMKGLRKLVLERNRFVHIPQVQAPSSVHGLKIDNISHLYYSKMSYSVCGWILTTKTTRFSWNGHL